MSLSQLSNDALNAALGAAARAVIQSLQAMPKLQGAKVAIVGGMAVRHYVGNERRTMDVDVLLFRPDDPIDNHLIRKELVSQFSDLFQEGAEPLFFKYEHPDQLKTYLVQVDIIPEYLPPYLPAQAMTLEDVDISHLPFVDPLDLLAYKVHCSSMRSCVKKRKQDAEDATTLWQTRYGQEYVPLSEGQRDAIASGVDLMAEYSRHCPWRKWRLRQWVNQ